MPAKQNHGRPTSAKESQNQTGISSVKESEKGFKFVGMYSQPELDTLKARFENIDNLTSKLSTYFNRVITKESVFAALFMVFGDKFDLEWGGDLWDVDIPFEASFEALKEIDFDLFEKIIETDINVLHGAILIEKKHSFKVKGVWRLHKYDADPFPSCPHLHELDQNIKLDLRNGNCYRKKQYRKTISKKTLLELRKQILEIWDGELPPLEV